MLHMLMQFPSGRLHATPWGRHVNEGEVEWPPSPWRIYRALVAVGFNRLGWTEMPTAARMLFDAFAQRLPIYHLPAATAAHTRHYLPQFKGSPSKVLDTFAYVGRGPENVVSVSWDVDLNPESLTLFDALLENITYIGRAESWVDMRRVGEIPEGLDRCAPSESAPGPSFDRIPLLAPLDPDAYASWRMTALDQEKQKRFSAEDADGNKKTKKTKGPSKKDLDAMQALFPADIVAVLGADTATLQKLGWNQPPGTRWVSYWRRTDALTTLPAERVAVTTKRAPIDTALLALSSNNVHADVLPQFTESLRWLDGLHDTLVKMAIRASTSGQPSACLSGRDDTGKPLEGHKHASLYPLTLDPRQGRLDHVLVHAPMGFDDAAIQALRALRRLYTGKKSPDIFVSLNGLGTIVDMQPTIPQLQSSRLWRSITPFVPPRFLKPRGNNSLEGQIRAELASRGMPDPLLIEMELESGYAPISEAWSLWRSGVPAIRLADQTAAESTELESRILSRAWRHFRRQRFDRSKGPPIDAAFGLRLSFPCEITGPLAIGYASHFGLGQFIPT